jgi:hypothetical protein
MGVTRPHGRRILRILGSISRWHVAALPQDCTERALWLP